MRGKSIAHRIGDVSAVEPNQRSRRTVGANGVDKDHMIRFGEQSEKRKAECSAVGQMHARRHTVFTLHASDRGGPKPVIAKQDVAQSQDQDANSLSAGRR
jgi:hypothetical protein